MTTLIGLDWGTTNARALRFDAAGKIVELREKPLGILRVANGDFAGAFAELVGDWRAAAPRARVLMCGMIGSRQGWREARYAALPADARALAGALLDMPEIGGAIVPGIAGDGLAGAPDVIRGEETQAIGVVALTACRDVTLCLPGSHSKWLEIRDGRLARFATFMTGESFAALKDHTILGRQMTGTASDAVAFAGGLARAKEAGGLLHHLFTVRTDGLFARLAPESAAAFLSGLLIGHEIAAALAAFASREVIVVGSEQLATPYRAALEAAGCRVSGVAGEVAVGAGLWQLATAAGMAA
ncbi:MAG: 2-dehydro-3-deoxygalactonokinase [Alphaproteobacteria bacterium]|nr:2-dehydro-3-deoxygalactonokinase [Alphaproteobacteria bacterium]